MKLSKRQLEVAYHIATGKSNKEISSAIGVTEKTVKFHATLIYKELGIQRRGQVVHALNKLNIQLSKTDPVTAPVAEKEIKSDENNLDRLPSSTTATGSAR